jgi:hypothetical protein
VRLSPNSQKTVYAPTATTKKFVVLMSVINHSEGILGLMSLIFLFCGLADVPGKRILR